MIVLVPVVIAFAKPEAEFIVTMLVAELDQTPDDNVLLRLVELPGQIEAVPMIAPGCALIVMPYVL